MKTRFLMIFSLSVLALACSGTKQATDTVDDKGSSIGDHVAQPDKPDPLTDIGADKVVPGPDGDSHANLPDGEIVGNPEPGPEVMTEVQVGDTKVDAEQAGQDAADGQLEEISEPEKPDHFPSAELGIKILSPNSSGKAQVPGGAIGLAGIVMGNPDAMYFETSSGESGYMQGKPFWNSEKLDLVQGDNWVTVTAIKGDEEATDTVMITYNPAFMFGGFVQVAPRATFTNVNTDLLFRMDMGLFQNFEPSTLKICECTEEGECIGEFAKAMCDTGNLNLCGDEYMADSIYSDRKSYNVDEPGKLCFRAHAQVMAGYLQYTAYSPVTCVDVVDFVSQGECDDMQAVQDEAQQLYWETEGTDGANAARNAVVELLEGNEAVAEVGVSHDGYGVWMRFENGILGAFEFGPDGYRGGEGDGEDFGQLDAALPGDAPEVRVESKRTMVLAGAHEEFGDFDEGQFAYQVLDNSECPTYILDSPYYDDKASLYRYRRMHEYGMVVITGHGDSYFKEMSIEAKKSYDWNHGQSQELVWTGEPTNCSAMLTNMPNCTGPGTCQHGSECVITKSGGGANGSGVCVDVKQVDLRTGRIVMGPDTYGILPSFIKNYPGFGKGYPSSLVYMGTCRSLWNGTLAMEFFGMGAMTIVGYSGYMTSEFAYGQATEFFSAAVEELKLVGDSLQDPPEEDPDNPGTVLRLFGAPNLNVTDAEIINASWETGDLTGWQSSGDGRVVSQLCCSIPVEGKFMGLVSTGMGFTQQVGEIYQTFCLPEDKSEMSLYWKFYSEEFKEYCGSIFQDTFEATIENDDGMVTCVSASIDELCPPQECSGCGALYDGMIQSCCIFDQGDPWETTWRKSECNIMALAGQGASTLRFFCTDKGDSIFDSVILIDAIKFK